MVLIESCGLIACSSGFLEQAARNNTVKAITALERMYDHYFIAVDARRPPFDGPHQIAAR
jgi:hypothetical protein